ncbi:hypothetical protein LSH36_24g12161 [Paralvinella palmiformis]|uniref:CUB domain-containing protein n=1 Tax=Paralvinella palmiformis TaxID=53620 RepID=A0AAD9KAW8_9ANNE|nr:hypothetical protein LSH36_24g12161 [Paralvinella palmiformis]
MSRGHHVCLVVRTSAHASVMERNLFRLMSLSPFVPVSPHRQCDDATRPLIVDTNLALIESPGYDGTTQYPDNLFCEWLVISPEDVELSLNAFQLEDCIECSCDFLSIYDGSNDTGPLLHNLCGGNLDILPLMVVSSSKMFIRFKTDGSTTGNLVGFSSRVQFLDGACETNEGKNVYGPSGTIVSPNYPNDYPDGADCVWNFKAPEGQIVQIEFTSLDIQDGCGPGFIDGFVKDYVQFIDSDRRTSLGRWFGNEFVAGFTFQNYQGNEPYLQFYSDATTTAPGFNTTSTEAQCSDDDRPMNITSPGVTIRSPGFNGEDPYPANQTCEWLIQTGNEIMAVTVNFLTLLVERCDDCGCDSVTVYDGSDDTAPILSTLCGAPAMPLAVAGGQTVFIRFTSCDGGVVITEPSGWLTSPNYPNDYPNLIMCTWNFVAPASQRVQIHFEEFILQDSTCNFPLIGGGDIPDFVLFTENGGQTELARWYGFMDSYNALSYRNYDGSNATVRFFSDQTTVEKGFNMTWKFGESTESNAQNDELSVKI